MAGDILVSIEGIQGSAIIGNSFTGIDRAGTFFGGSQGDNMVGNGGCGGLVGDLGDDTLDGGNGQDIPMSGFGNDVLGDGGTGHLDVFTFERNHYDDTTTHFELGEGIVLFPSSGVEQSEFVFDDNPAGVMLSLTTGSMTIQFLGPAEAAVTTDVDTDSAFNSFSVV